MNPRISVVVATYRRPEPLIRAINSILASDHDSFELIVVDQNEQSDLASRFADPRLRVLLTPPVGASAARNLGAREALGELIACTDDDCEAGPLWLRAMEEAFARQPEAGMVLGSVMAGVHDESLGFIPACLRRVERMHRRFFDCPELEVMGASMALRKPAWVCLGGFREDIGPGTPVAAGEDYDLAVRALESGIPVLECPGAVVTHHGFRAWQQGPSLLEGYAFGTARVVGYHLAFRPLDLMRCLVRFWSSYRHGKSLIIRSARQSRANRPLHFARGLVAGMAARWSRRIT